MNYRIIKSNSLQGLADTVSKLLEEGHILRGGVAMTSVGGRVLYAQAMTISFIAENRRHVNELIGIINGTHKDQ